MILVIGGIADTTAQKLIEQFSGEAVLLTTLDLSMEGTSFHFHQFENGILMAQGKTIPSRSISGVVSLVGNFYPQELVQINEEDRDYVCREMNAFMIWMLSQFRCPMLNRSSANCFSGYFRRLESWVALARRCGIPCLPVTRDSNKFSAPPPKTGTNLVSVTVIGREAVGCENEELCEYAFRLAKQADLELVKVVFAEQDSRGYEFCGASQFPDLSNEVVLKGIPVFFESKL